MSRPPSEGFLQSLEVTEGHELLSSIWELQKVTKSPKLSSFFIFMDDEKLFGALNGPCTSLPYPSTLTMPFPGLVPT